MIHAKNPIVSGTFSLTSGVELIRGQQGGVLLQKSPLRAIRFNGAAFDILCRCQNGFSLTDLSPEASAERAGSVLTFLDALCGVHLLHWTPEPKASELPSVSIIVPVYNRAEDIGECLDSLCCLNYPPAQYEIIVVDDASEDDTAAVVQQYEVKLIVQERNRGQSAARNAGVAATAGEIVAFIDSDCVADANWLRELTPYFQDPRIALVGGYVASQFNSTRLDRYETVKSPLNMGSNTVTCKQADSDFYVPTCNMLVRKSACLEVGGLDESWHVGEDVDLCWKLKKRNHRLAYVPQGRVNHKHRHRFAEVFKRRFDYGTSEPALYDRHREVSKRFPWQPVELLFSLACCLGLLTKSVLFVLAALLLVVMKAHRNRMEIAKKSAVALTYFEVFRATFKNCYSLAYHICLHLVRYYFVLFVFSAILFPALLPLWLVVALFPPLVQYFRLRPDLSLPLFVVFFLMEQTFYQAGVFVNCLKTRSFRCYRVRFAATAAGNEPAAGLFRRIRALVNRRRTEKAF